MSRAAPAAEDEEGFSWTVLPRHGRRPLGFTGRMLFRFNNEQMGLPLRSEISVFETRDGRFAAAIQHSSAAPWVFRYADARLCTAVTEVHAAFADHQPDMVLSLELLVPSLQSHAIGDTGRSGEAALISCEAHLRQVRLEWQRLVATAFGKYTQFRQTP